MNPLFVSFDINLFLFQALIGHLFVPIFFPELSNNSYDQTFEFECRDWSAKHTHLPARRHRYMTALASPMRATILVVCIRGCLLLLLLLKKMALLSPLPFLLPFAVLGGSAAVSALCGRIDIIMG